MAYLLEKTGSTRCTLEANKREPFTQKIFSDLINDSHTKNHDYYIARIQCKDEQHYCYDAKQLCKYVFEMVISSEGRKIRVKNFRDPISHKEINEIHFFKLKYDTDAPLRAEYIGNHDNFLESNCFRSKIFYQEDALDALSVNFQFNQQALKPNYTDKKRLFSFFLLIVFSMILLASIFILIERNAKVGYRDREYKTKLRHSLFNK